MVGRGAEPRRLLRYHFTAHSVVNIHSRWIATLKLRDAERPAPYIEIEADEWLRVASVSSDGSANFDFQVTNGSSQTRDFDGQETSTGIEGVRGSGVIDSRGALQALNGVDGRSIDANAALLVSDCLVDELPLEPVGVGASWQSGKYADWLVTLIYLRPNHVYLGYGTEDNAPFRHPELARRDPRPLHVGFVAPEPVPAGAGGVDTTLIDLSNIGSFRMLAVDEFFNYSLSSTVSHRVSRTECSSVTIEQTSKEAAATSVTPQG